jgi:dihydrolipoamide dehydrogenase
VREVDVAVVGAGTAGLASRLAARQEGADVVLLDGGPLGTTCARIGCMPSKLLMAAAREALRVREAARFGLDARLEIDSEQVMQRVRQLRDEFVASVRGSIESLPEGEFVRSRAGFAAPGRLLLEDGGEIRARAVVLAVGASPRVRDPWKKLGDKVLTEETLFDLETLPRSLAVIGAGPTGLELGEALALLGVRVCIFEKTPTLSFLEDERIAACAAQLVGRHVQLVLNADDLTPNLIDDVVRLAWTHDGHLRHEDFEGVLIATGRQPNTEELHLDRVSPTPASGSSVIDVIDACTLQYGDQPIFFAGDGNQIRPLLHEATWEGELAGRNAARWPDLIRRERRPRLEVVFTEPQLAHVGDIGGRGRYAVGEAEFVRQGRARVEGENQGLLRLFAEPDGGGVVTGAEMAAPAAEHLAQIINVWVSAGMTARGALQMSFFHPTLEEALRSAARALCASLNQMPPERASDLEAGPGA